MKKISLNIVGMHCASCAANIEHDIKKLDGIKLVNVNYASEKALVDFDETKIDIGKITAVIIKGGYQIIDNTNNNKSIQNTTNKSEFTQNKTNYSKFSKSNKRFWISLILGLPIIYLVMGKMLGLPIPEMSMMMQVSLQLFFSTLVIIANWSLWLSGIKGLIKLRPNMDALIFLGTAAAYFYSLYNTIQLFTGSEFTMENFYTIPKIALIVHFCIDVLVAQIVLVV